MGEFPASVSASAPEFGSVSLVCIRGDGSHRARTRQGSGYNAGVFLHRERDPAGPLFITQVSHAWLAWQIAEHWGNRAFARPAPRAEVLAAVLLHDGGWTDFDPDPGVDEDGRPVTFDRMPPAAHLDIWRSSVARAAEHSRYAGLLVAAHHSRLVERKTGALLDRSDTTGARAAQAFRAEMERLQATWREGLKVDARYRPYLEGAAWEASLALLEACDSVSVYLCAQLGAPFTVTAHSPSGDLREIRVSSDDGVVWRVHPWPLEGERVRLHCEGRRTAGARFPSRETLSEALRRAPTERLTFVLERPSAG